MELIINIFLWTIMIVASVSFAVYTFLLFKDVNKKRQEPKTKVVFPYPKTETRTPLPEYETSY